MKISRKNLNKLIEAFIATADGKVRRIGPDHGADYEHPQADKIMGKATGNLPANLRDKLSTMYSSSDDDPETKKQAIELAAGLGTISSDEVDSAKFDIDVALDPRFEQFKEEEFYRGGTDLGLMKSFLNHLHKKGELVTTDPKKPYLSVYDIGDMFEKRYPGQLAPDDTVYERLGVDVFDSDFLVVGYDPEKFEP
jgi:hypothetical protein